MLNTLNERTKPRDDTAVDSPIALLGDDILLIFALLPLIISFFYAMYRHTNKPREFAQRELALTKVKQEIFELQKKYINHDGEKPLSVDREKQEAMLNESLNCLIMSASYMD